MCQYRKLSSTLSTLLERTIFMSYAPPLQVPTKFDASPIFRPFYETELKRITSEGETYLNI